MTAEQITAIGGVIVAIVAAMLGYAERRQAKKIADLTERVDRLEVELSESKSLLRMAVEYIRQLRVHILELRWAHRAEETPPAEPEVPELLRKEI